LVGGSEALNGFHDRSNACAQDLFSQRRAYPNRAFDLNKTQSTMILGEGAGVCCLENGKRKCISFSKV
jgi:hypothetical protein